MEDMEVESVRRFVGLRLSGPLPDETTILNFRHLLEEHELGQSLFEEINRHLESQGLRLREGTIVDASIIEAPSSTKNRSGERDPEMRQHEGTHRSPTTTPANVHDVTEAVRYPLGARPPDRVVSASDASYQGCVQGRQDRLNLLGGWPWVNVLLKSPLGCRNRYHSASRQSCSLATGQQVVKVAPLQVAASEECE